MYRKVLSALIGSCFLGSLSSCGDADSPGDAADSPGDVERALDTLPEEPGARATALDGLAESNPDDPRVTDAIRELEDASSVGLLRHAELDGGRRISFYQPDAETLMVIEMGPVGVESLAQELGLSQATPEDLWSYLFGSDSVPQLVADASRAADAAVDAADITEVPSESRPGESLVGGGSPLTEARRISGDVGQVQQAFSSNGDDFLRAGGCATRPAMNAADYPGLVFTPCNPNWGNGYFASAFSSHARWRFASYSGGGFNARTSINGTTTSTRFVPLGFWANIEVSRNGTCSSWCCGIFGNCFVTCASCPNPNNATLRIDIVDAANDGFHAGSIFFSTVRETRQDTQPWF